ncbi:tRNA uridine-5-carboxymethylaminomethyl(34) synthesis GTPase MnmE, partial [Clostridium perfringens]|uniref:GTPase n=1 Tax=Clostridium perfringens TaxID=1502 RepID=UPI002AC62E94
TNKVLEMVIKSGARLAEPGEFTKRAFLNGRIDLSQAEAVMDLITAKTELAMKSASMQSTGSLSEKINKLSEYLLNVLALIEYAVDFTEDDEEVDPSIPLKVKESLEKALDDMNKLLKSADEGKVIRDGLSLAIVGKPNVGKSSLLNVLLKEKRAIVTDIAGTT